MTVTVKTDQQKLIYVVSVGTNTMLQNFRIFKITDTLPSSN